MGALMTIHKEEPLHGQLGAVKTNLDEAMNNIRESVHDLHDESIDLRQAISDLMDEIKESFECSLDYDIGDNIDRKYKYAIIGIIREAVSNILKHSKNDSVDIIVREHPGMYQLVIHDYVKNGTRQEQIQVTKNIGRADGIGIQNMQDRVRSLRGNISIDEANGYKIFVTFPK
jgi:signal transduction histidine kinase